MAIKHRIDEIYTATPCYGSRRITDMQREGHVISRKTVQRHMREMQIAGTSPVPNLSKRAHKAVSTPTMDNVFTERLWRSIKYEEVYLRDYGTPRAARDRITRYLGWYNTQRLHQALAYQTPAEVYFAPGERIENV